MSKRGREEGSSKVVTPGQKKPLVSKDTSTALTRAALSGAVGDTLESVASRCRDNITGVLLVDPVIAEDGHTYERAAITEWFRRHNPSTSPLTHEEIGAHLKPNYAIRDIVDYLANSPGISTVERAEWHVSKAKHQCEGFAGHHTLWANNEKTMDARKPDVAAAKTSFERAEKLVVS